MATNDYILHKMNSSSDWEEKVFTAVNGQVLGFDSNLNPSMVNYKAITVATKTTISLTWTEADYFVCSISANGGISFSSMSTGIRVALVKNTGSSSIDIAIPNTSGNVYKTATESIAAGKAKEISCIYDGSTAIWNVSAELLVSV